MIQATAPTPEQCPECLEALRNLGDAERAWWACTSCAWQGSQGQLDAERKPDPWLLDQRITEIRESEEKRHARIRQTTIDRLGRVSTRESHRQDLSEHICPGCTCAGYIYETVAPLAGKRGHTGSYACRCGWTGTGQDLTWVTEEEARDITEDQVKRLLAEEAKRGTKGGGSRSGKRKGDDRGMRVTGIASLRNSDGAKVWSRVAEKRSKIVKVPGLTVDADTLRDALAWKAQQRAAELAKQQQQESQAS